MRNEFFVVSLVPSLGLMLALGLMVATSSRSAPLACVPGPHRGHSRVS